MTNYLNAVISVKDKKEYNRKKLNKIFWIKHSLENYIKQMNRSRRYNKFSIMTKKFNRLVVAQRVEFEDNTNQKFNLDSTVRKMTHFICELYENDAFDKQLSG